MSAISRAIRHTARRRLRTLGVTMIIALSIAGFLMFFEIGQDIAANVATADSAVANLISVEGPSSGGGFGFLHAPMTAPGLVQKVQRVPGVVSVQRVFMSFPQAPATGITGTMPVPYEGIDITPSGTLLDLGSTTGGSPFTITAGRDLTPADQNQAVGLASAMYASANGLRVGQIVGINGTSFTLVGLYSTGSNLDSGGPYILPYPVSSAALQVPGPNFLYVTVLTTASLHGMIASIEATLGSNYEVLALSSEGSAVQGSLANLVSTAQVGAYLALALGTLVVAVVTVLLTAQRKREIGLLKLLGYGDGRISGQFAVESLLCGSLGLPVGLALSLLLGPSVAGLVTSSAPAGTAEVDGHSIAVSSPLLNVGFGLGPSVLFEGLLLTVGIAIVAAFIPVIRIARMRPAEALRID